jgi:hypothetical protein
MINRLRVILVSVIALVACHSGLRQATIGEIHQAERQWENHPILNYKIVVDVQQQNELRRNALNVRDGQITHAVVSYWNSRRNKWELEESLKLQQALPFTVPGLLETVEEEISNSNRSEIEVAMKGDPPVPKTILLGNLLQNNQRVAGSKAYIFVRSFLPSSQPEAGPIQTIQALPTIAHK